MALTFATGFFPAGGFCEPAAAADDFADAGIEEVKLVLDAVFYRLIDCAAMLPLGLGAARPLKLILFGPSVCLLNMLLLLVF